MKSLPENSRQTSRAQAALPRPDTSKAEHTIRRRFIVASPFVAPPRLGRVSVVTEGAFTPIVQCSMDGQLGRPGDAPLAIPAWYRLTEVARRRSRSPIDPTRSRDEVAANAGGRVPRLPAAATRRRGSFPRGGNDAATPRSAAARPR